MVLRGDGGEVEGGAVLVAVACCVLYVCACMVKQGCWLPSGREKGATCILPLAASLACGGGTAR